jgi:YgiT-type zinc finger domain-containing protein
MTRCVLCYKGHLRSLRLTLTLSYGGATFTIDEDNGRTCDHCHEEYMGARAALVTHRTLAPQARMSVTIMHRGEPARDAGPSCSAGSGG